MLEHSITFCIISLYIPKMDNMNKIGFYFGHNDEYIKEHGFKQFCEKIKTDKISELDLFERTISDDEAILLADMLKVNTTLKKLNIRFCSITVTGISKITEALEVNTTLKTLDLSSAHFGNNGAIKLAKMLKNNKSIETLIICDNSIGDSGMIEIAEALKSNNKLKELNINDNRFADNAANKIVEVISINKTLKKLYMAYNCITVMAADTIVKALQNNKTLIELRFDKMPCDGIMTQLNDCLARNKNNEKEIC